MIHEVRMIPLNGGPHLPASIKQLNGDPRAHWEGETLVVDSTNFTDRTNVQGQSMETTHLIERFTRTGPNVISYQYTVDDPAKWTQKWTAELPLVKIDGPIFEYACHEGNYGLANQLSGARADEKAGIQPPAANAGGAGGGRGGRGAQGAGGGRGGRGGQGGQPQQEQ